jgi:co-chaperonin GroES (HSP10)
VGRSVNEVQESVRPLRDRILVVVDPKEQVRPSGLILPGTVDRGTLRTGLILRMGPGRLNPETGLRVPMDDRLGPGVRVCYLHFQAFETATGARGGFRRADEAETCILYEGDILGVYDGPVGGLRN